MNCLTAILRLIWFICTGAILYFALARGEAGGLGGASYHVLAFFVLGLLTPAAFPRINLALIWIVLLALGGGIELAQGMMGNGRHGEWDDFFADAVAASAGIVCYWLSARGRAGKAAAASGAGHVDEPET